MAAARLRIAQAFGIPVYLHVSWTVILVVMVWSPGSAYFPAQDPGASALVHGTQAVAAWNNDPFLRGRTRNGNVKTHWQDRSAAAPAR